MKANSRTKLKKQRCLLIPGMGEHTEEKPYKEIAKHLKSKGWAITRADILWNRTTLTGWLKQVRHIAKNKEFDMIFGFSFGAMMSLILANDLRPRSIICASPSPYFKEELPLLPQMAFEILGIRRMTDFKKYSLADIKKIRSTRVHILVAQNDFPLLKKMAPKIKLLAGKNATLTLVRGAAHDLADRAYMQACVAAIIDERKRRAA